MESYNALQHPITLHKALRILHKEPSKTPEPRVPCFGPLGAASTLPGSATPFTKLGGNGCFECDVRSSCGMLGGFWKFRVFRSLGASGVYMTRDFKTV